MIVCRSRVLAVGAVALALTALIAGCGRAFQRYSGKPLAYSTHPWRVEVPASFSSELYQQQATYGRMTIGAFRDQILPPGSQGWQQVARVFIRCYKLHKGETISTFLERLQDELAPTYTDITVRRVRKGPSGGAEYEVSAGQNTVVSRLIPLPKEGLVYEVQTASSRQHSKQYRLALRRARDSLRLLPVPR